MILSDWRDLPQRREDDAYDAGYAPDASDFRPLPPVAEPDREKFTAEYVAEIEQAKAHASDTGCDRCGERCASCGERMCATWGPEPAVACAAHDDECADCGADNRCPECLLVRIFTGGAA